MPRTYVDMCGEEWRSTFNARILGSFVFLFGSSKLFSSNLKTNESVSRMCNEYCGFHIAQKKWRANFLTKRSDRHQCICFKREIFLYYHFRYFFFTSIYLDICMVCWLMWSLSVLQILRCLP